MTDAEHQAIAHTAAALRATRNAVAVLLIIVATVTLGVSLFQPWLYVGNDSIGIGALSPAVGAAFLIGVMVLFVTAGACVTLVGQARRTVTAAGLAIVAPLLAVVSYLPVSVSPPDNAGPGPGVFLAGGSVLALGFALLLTSARIVVETSAGPRTVVDA